MASQKKLGAATNILFKLENNMSGRPSWNPSLIDCNKAREMASRGLTMAKGSILIHTAKSILSIIMTVVNR
jgi:hypothetical protein